MEPTQADRRASISTPLGDDKLVLRSFSGKEQLGRMFRYECELLSPDPDIKLSDLLGHPVTLSMTMPDDGTRFFNGFVTSFALVGHVGRLHVYSATVEPWLWFLTRTADSRIFPEKNGQDKVPQIIMGIFREHGFSDFEDKLQRSYKPREHCVQYRETDFNFVMRLMEDEGIYFWFKHEDGKHTMVLCDDYGSHEAIKDYEEVPCYPGGDRQDIEYLDTWGVRESVQAGMVALNDYDFMRPKADLQVKSKVTREHEHADFEMYDFPGEYVDPADGEAGDKPGNDDLKSAFEQVAKTRIEELHTQFESAEGGGNVKGLYAGGLFSIVEHPREDQNREYLIVSARFELQSDDFGTGGGSAEQEFHCGLTAIEATTPFRSQRLTPKPTIQGIQTATVTGPSGEPIHTDKYGRVKLQFPWDRYGEGDENSSCWVRVSQNRAGKTWGDMQLPHVGQEVVVSFLEGDPDRPIVIGRVYNEDNMPPGVLPAAQHKTIFRDHFGNEMVFDGTPGEEHIQLHSPQHSSSLLIGKSFQWETKSNKCYFTNGNAHTTTVGSTTSVMCGHAFSFTAGATESVQVGVKFSGFAGADFGITAGGKFSYEAAGSASFGYAWKYTSVKQQEVKVNGLKYIRSAGDDIVMDSVKNVVLVGGEKDNSIVECTKTKLVLAFGEDPSAGAKNPAAIGKSEAIKPTIYAALAGALAAGTAAAAGLAAAGATWSQKKDGDQLTAESPIRDNLVAPLAGGAVAGFALAVAAAAKASKGAKAILKDVERDATNQTTVHSTLTLDENGIILQANQNSSWIQLDKDGNVTIFGKGQIAFKGTKEILFHEFMKVDDKELKFTKTQKLVMKSLEVT